MERHKRIVLHQESQQTGSYKPKCSECLQMLKHEQMEVVL